MNIRVKTEYPIYVNERQVMGYSGADASPTYGPDPKPSSAPPITPLLPNAGSGGSGGSSSPKKKMASGAGKKILAGLKKAKDSGFLQKAASLFLSPGQPRSSGTKSTVRYTPPTEKGMSTGAKIAIGVSVAAIVGIGIYLAVRKKK